MWFLWVKVGHIVSFVAWFAGIFYIWRLFVYHSESTSIDVKKQFEIMEKRLYKYIMSPACISTFIFGFLLVLTNYQYYLKSGWFYVKLVLFCLVVVNHFMANYYRIQLSKNKVYKSKKFRILNEIPTILLIFIVMLAVLKNRLIE